ncbi:MAG: hypothetical protein EXR62_01795 [Chloroflexi bacterium]|nr:hypothetical protein [Chloroflexota bacterium]
MTQIRCWDNRCIFNEAGMCTSDEIEYHPDHGCLTMEEREDYEEEAVVEAEWEDEEEGFEEEAEGEEDEDAYEDWDEEED